jgi:septal ring factor EnvC (AmiA/AmiB activator)
MLSGDPVPWRVFTLACAALSACLGFLWYELGEIADDRRAELSEIRASIATIERDERESAIAIQGLATTLERLEVDLSAVRQALEADEGRGR